MVSMMIVNTCLVGFAFLMLWAAYNDVRSFKIPNWIPAVMCLSWVVAAPFLGLGLSGLGAHLLTFIVILAIGMGIWSQGLVGGGDVKLIAAGALWFGWPDALSFLFAGALAGGVLALGLMGIRKVVSLLPVTDAKLDNTVLQDGAPAPYAVAIAAGALWVLPHSSIFAQYIA